MPSQRATRATKVLKGTAALDPLLHKRRLETKKMTKTTPGHRKHVSRTFSFHLVPPNTETSIHNISRKETRSNVFI